MALATFTQWQLHETKRAGPTGTCGHCGAVNTPAGIGLEPTLGEWVENIVAVMREVRRVLAG